MCYSKPPRGSGQGGSRCCCSWPRALCPILPVLSRPSLLSFPSLGPAYVSPRPTEALPAPPSVLGSEGKADPVHGLSKPSFYLFFFSRGF